MTDQGKRVCTESGSSRIPGWYSVKARLPHPNFARNIPTKGIFHIDKDGKPYYFKDTSLLSVKEQHELMRIIKYEQQFVNDIEESVEDKNFWMHIRYRWAQISGTWINYIELKDLYDTMYILESMNFFYFWHPPELFQDPDIVANEFRRCYQHRWTKENCELLKVLHQQEMLENKDDIGDFLSGAGWVSVHRKFVTTTRHVVGLHELQLMFHKLNGSLKGNITFNEEENNLDCNGVPLRDWSDVHDEFLMNGHEELRKAGLGFGKRKKFLDGSDWQILQKKFYVQFHCKPSLTQLQSRVHALQKNLLVEQLREYKRHVEEYL